MTLQDLRQQVLARLGDPNETVWTRDEVDLHLVNAYQQIAQVGRVFWDWVYLENLPATFSATATWEIAHGYVAFNAGLANYTCLDERRLLDETHRIGPACCTCPVEATDGWLAAAGASAAIPATADMPKAVTEIARGVFDRRGIDAVTPRDMVRADARYELTTGEVYAYLWQKDGVRTVRKVRVPQGNADTLTVTGSWGLLRNADQAEG